VKPGRCDNEIDVPLKALAWEDAEGRIWLTYNDVAWLTQRHQLGADSSAAVAALDAGLSAVAQAATTVEAVEK
jgi:uncharacterized protein (DUF302 family)